jgi:hypothetical protein
MESNDPIVAKYRVVLDKLQDLSLAATSARNTNGLHEDDDVLLTSIETQSSAIAKRVDEAVADRLLREWKKSR